MVQDSAIEIDGKRVFYWKKDTPKNEEDQKKNNTIDILITRNVYNK